MEINTDAASSSAAEFSESLAQQGAKSAKRGDEGLLALLSPRGLAYLEEYAPTHSYTTSRRGRLSTSHLCTFRTIVCQYFIDTQSRFIYNLCMMPLMVKEADLDRIDVPEDYEVVDATALGRRLGFKRDTVLAYLSRRNFRRIPRPNRQLAMGPIWYEQSVREWEAKEDQRRGK